MTLRYLSMTAAVAAMLAGGAVAQDTTTDPNAVPNADMSAVEDNPMLTPQFTSIEDMTVGDVLGMIVYDPTGDQIGEIDYVISGINGPEAVIGIGGFLGLGEYTVAWPMSEYHLRDDGRSFEVDTDKERMEQMPEFDETGAESLPDEVLIGSLMGDHGVTGDTMDDGNAMDDPLKDEDAMDDPLTDEDAMVDEETMDDGPESDEVPLTDGTAADEATTTQ